MVNRLTKYALFIPTRGDTFTTDFVMLFFEHVKYKFSIPENVVTDRDNRITLDFWTEVYYYKVLKRRLSTAFYP